EDVGGGKQAIISVADVDNGLAGSNGQSHERPLVGRRNQEAGIVVGRGTALVPSVADRIQPGGQGGVHQASHVGAGASEDDTVVGGNVPERIDPGDYG